MTVPLLRDDLVVAASILIEVKKKMASDPLYPDVIASEVAVLAERIMAVFDDVASIEIPECRRRDWS